MHLCIMFVHFAHDISAASSASMYFKLLFLLHKFLHFGIPYNSGYEKFLLVL